MEEYFLPAKVASGCFVIGVLFLIHGHNRKNYIKALLKSGIKTEGKVVEICRDPGPLFSKEEGKGFAPVVEYTTDSGNILKHHSTTYKTPCTYKVDQLVPIWYINYKSRREATLQDDEPGTLPKNLFIIGSILCLIGAPIFYTKLLQLF